jgi:hypothetical protein
VDRGSSFTANTSDIGKWDGETGKTQVFLSSGGRGPLKWFEIWAVVVLCISASTGLLGWGIFSYMNNPQRQLFNYRKVGDVRVL